MPPRTTTASPSHQSRLVVDGSPEFLRPASSDHLAA